VDVKDERAGPDRTRDDVTRSEGAPPETRLHDDRGPATDARRRRRRIHVAVAILFFGFSLAELWTPIVHGSYFMPGDIGQDWPLTHVAGGPHHPRTPSESDVYDDFGPFLRYDISQFDAGHLATWNPYNGNGQPYLADAQTVVLSPFTLPFYFLSFRLALIVAALARLWLLAFFTYLFLARTRIRIEAAAVGGALFAFAGYHLLWLDYQTHVSVSATLPTALWCLRVALDHRDAAVRGVTRGRAVRLLALTGLAIALGVIVLDGHPETAVFDDVLIGGYALIAVLRENRARRARLQWLGRLGGVAVLGVAISAVQLLPFLQYSGEGLRYGTNLSGLSSVAGYSAQSVPLMAFQNLFGAPQLPYSDATYYSGTNPASNYVEEDSNSVGLLALCLVPVSLVAMRRRKHGTLAVFGTSACALGSLMLYTRWFGEWWHVLPVLGQAGLFRSQDVQLMGIAVLGALAVDWVLDSRDELDEPGRQRVAGVLVGSFAVVTAILVLMSGSLRRVNATSAASHSPTALSVVRGNLNFEIVLATLFLSALLVTLLSMRVVAHAAAGLSLIVMAFLSDGGPMLSYNTSVNQKLFYPVSKPLKEVQRIVRSAEVLYDAGSFAVPETNLAYGMYDIGSYDGIGLVWHDVLYDKVFDEIGNPGAEQMPACIEGLQLFGVQYVVGGFGTWLHTAVGALPAYRTVRLNRKTNITVYSVPGSNLVGLVDSSIQSSGGDERAVAKAMSCSFHSDYTVILDHSAFNDHAEGTLSRPSGSTTLLDKATLVHRSDESFTVSTSSPTGGWMVIREAYAPGWQATVDGKPAAVARADVAFMAVRVPAGRHTVVLTYTSSTVSNGLILTLLGSIVALGLTGLGVRWLRLSARTPAPSSPGATLPPPAAGLPAPAPPVPAPSGPPDRPGPPGPAASLLPPSSPAPPRPSVPPQDSPAPPPRTEPAAADPSPPAPRPRPVPAPRTRASDPAAAPADPPAPPPPPPAAKGTAAGTPRAPAGPARSSRSAPAPKKSPKADPEQRERRAQASPNKAAGPSAPTGSRTSKGRTATQDAAGPGAPDRSADGAKAARSGRNERKAAGRADAKPNAREVAKRTQEMLEEIQRSSPKKRSTPPKKPNG